MRVGNGTIHCGLVVLRRAAAPCLHHACRGAGARNRRRRRQDGRLRGGRSLFARGGPAESDRRNVRRGGENRRAARPVSCRPRALPHDDVGTGDGDTRQRQAGRLRALRPGLDRQAARAVAAGSQARSSCPVAGSRRLFDGEVRRPAGRGGCLASRSSHADGVGARAWAQP